MLKSLTDGISIKLDSLFNQEEHKYQIYVGSIPQNFKTPCFFINLINSRQKVLTQSTFIDCKNNFDILFFPDENQYQNEANQECMHVADTLFYGLEWIDIDNNPRLGTNMDSKLVTEQNGSVTLHFFVSYDIMLYRPKARPDVLMEELILNEKINNEE